jgi:isocitrate/isopropylmalate dehydrogenase
MVEQAKRIAVIPGDGIGPEVIAEAVRVLECVRGSHDVKLQLTHFDWGADKFLKEGVSLPDGALEKTRGRYSARHAPRSRSLYQPATRSFT